MKKIRIAVIGCGMISAFHVKAIAQNPDAELAGMYDAFPAAAAEAAERNHVRAYRKLEEVWEDPWVDAVTICTPSGTHGPLALEAISHGKHVLVEKPMALTRQECIEIRERAREKQVRVGVVSQLRFSPGIRQVKQAMEENRLGRIFSTELNMKYYRAPEYFSASTWRGTKKMDGGGALMNQGIHGVDLLQYLTGMPRAVFAQSRTLLHRIQVEDTLHAMLMYENGALGTVIAATSIYPGFSRELTICGENGTVILEEDSIRQWKLKDGSTCEAVGPASARGSSDPGDLDVSGHAKQMENFIRAIQNKEKLLIDAEEGRKPLEIIWGIYRSAQENQIVKLEGED